MLRRTIPARPASAGNTEAHCDLAPSAGRAYSDPVNRPTHAPNRGDAEHTPVSPEVEAELRERLQTFDEDAKTARPARDVLADLKARRPLPTESHS